MNVRATDREYNYIFLQIRPDGIKLSILIILSLIYWPPPPPHHLKVKQGVGHVLFCYLPELCAVCERDGRLPHGTAARLAVTAATNVTFFQRIISTITQTNTSQTI